LGTRRTQWGKGQSPCGGVQECVRTPPWRATVYTQSPSQNILCSPPNPQFWGDMTDQSPPELGDLGGQMMSSEVKFDLCAHRSLGGVWGAEPQNAETKPLNHTQTQTARSPRLRAKDHGALPVGTTAPYERHQNPPHFFHSPKTGIETPSATTFDRLESEVLYDPREHLSGPNLRNPPPLRLRPRRQRRRNRPPTPRLQRQQRPHRQIHRTELGCSGLSHSRGSASGDVRSAARQSCH
jgi:hypothetical protein